jgi:phenylacetic acid degradation operon negative regulatory protein
MNAKIQAEEILTLIAYGLEMVTLPTLHKWDQSYEGWLYRNGLLRRIRYLEAQKLLAREKHGAEWVWRLTSEGSLKAGGGFNPEIRWERPWDGWWRQLVFDLPVGQQRARVQLIRWLRQQRFGYLQDSVWITPDPVEEVSAAVERFRDDAESFTILECRCAKGFANASLVAGAWPFGQIQRAYEVYREFASQALKRLDQPALHPRELFALLREERRQWLAAVHLDPLLPRSLWPAKYEGARVWQIRCGLLRKLAHRVL